MKREHVQLLHEILLVIGNHLFAMMFPITVLGMIGFETAYVGVWCGLLVIPFLFYAFRAKVNSSLLFAVLHFAVAGACAILPFGNIVVRVLVAAVAFVYMIASIYLRLHFDEPKEGKMHVIVPFVVGTVFMFAQGKYGNPAWTNYYLYLVTGFYGTYLLGFYAEKYLFFISMNEKTAEKVPEKEIFTSGFVYVFLFMLGSILCMLLGANVTVLNRFLQMLKHAVAFVLRNLFAGYEPQTAPGTEGVGGVEQEWLPPVEAQETWLIWKILEVVMYIILAVGAAVLIGALLFYLVRMLLHGLEKKTKTRERTLAEEADVREKIVMKKAVNGKGISFRRGSYRQRIRKVYEKTMIKEKKRLIGESEISTLKKLTPRECCSVLERDGLKQAYEKARYSAVECTREDMAQSKN